MGIQKSNLIGQSFGRLVVLSEAPDVIYGRGPKKKHRPNWNCQCSCGKMTTATTQNLRSGTTQSCGCLHTQKHTMNNPRMRRGRIGLAHWNDHLEDDYAGSDG